MKLDLNEVNRQATLLRQKKAIDAERFLALHRIKPTGPRVLGGQAEKLE